MCVCVVAGLSGDLLKIIQNKMPLVSEISIVNQVTLLHVTALQDVEMTEHEKRLTTRTTKVQNLPGNLK